MVCYQWSLPHLVLILFLFNCRDIRIGYKCQKWQISTRSELAPWAHFFKNQTLESIIFFKLGCVHVAFLVAPLLLN